MLVKGPPDGAKSLPEQMMAQAYWNQSHSNFTENVQDMLAKVFIWNPNFGFFMSLPWDNNLTG